MDSNHRPLPSQGSALYRLSYESNLAEAERFERSKVFTPGTLAECCHTYLATLPKWRRTRESNPARILTATVFRTVWLSQLPNPPEEIWQEHYDLNAEFRGWNPMCCR